MNLPTEQKQTPREQTYSCQGEGSGMDWEFGVSRSKLVYIRWKNSSYIPKELYSVSCDKP